MRLWAPRDHSATPAVTRLQGGSFDASYNTPCRDLSDPVKGFELFPTDRSGIACQAPLNLMQPVQCTCEIFADKVCYALIDQQKHAALNNLYLPKQFLSGRQKSD